MYFIVNAAARQDPHVDVWVDRYLAFLRTETERLSAGWVPTLGIWLARNAIQSGHRKRAWHFIQAAAGWLVEFESRN
jgi:hypothetical protein